jgi:hypothetical protein
VLLAMAPGEQIVGAAVGWVRAGHRATWVSVTARGWAHDVRARGTRRGEVGAGVLAAGSTRRRARVWGLGCAGEWAGARAGPNGRDGPGRGEAAAQGGLRARWAAGWGAGPFLFLFFFMFCSFLFSPPFQIELLIKRTLHKITHSRK